MDKHTQPTEVTDQHREPYVTPQVTDYGSLQQLTASHRRHGTTDVPMGTAGSQVFS